MKNTAIRLPLHLWQALAMQAAECGLPVSTYIRCQLAANLGNPTNIHKVK